MAAREPDNAEESVADAMDDAIPTYGFDQLPVVGLGGSAGAIPALVSFFQATPADTNLAFVVIVHLSPEHESTLAELLQRHTAMKVVQVLKSEKIQPNTVFVIPPRHILRMEDGHVELGDMPSETPGRVAVDLFFRTLADTHGPHAMAVVLSGLDSDGAIGIKRIKERGGLTIAQDPSEAQHSGMPRSAIGTGMVDWVLPVQQMPAKLIRYVEQESRLRLPPEDIELDPKSAANAPVSDADLREVLSFLRSRTGRDFGAYKRATILRRIGRRMLVNGVDELVDYLGCLRTRPGEAGALLQDLLISVTNFFRDSNCFAALEEQIPSLFQGKSSSDTVRVWVPACATGEEAYSIGMLLSEHARGLDNPPTLQIFATDLDEEAIRAAREGVYPPTIAADVSEERLRKFFTKEHRGFRVRRELREQVLFAAHDLLKDSPFSRLDLITCRNLLIYLNRDAQHRVLETAHFSLVPGGRLMLGASETVEDGSTLFFAADKKHRIYVSLPVPRGSLPMPAGQSSIARALEAQTAARAGPVMPGTGFAQGLVIEPRDLQISSQPETRSVSWSELHFSMLEMLGPPSIVIDGEHDIMHLSPNAGRFLQYNGGEPSRNLLHAVNPALRIELRAALYQASQGNARIDVVPLPIEMEGRPVAVRMTVTPIADIAPGMTLVTLEAVRDEHVVDSADERRVPAEADPLAHLLDRELERLKSHLRDTVEQYEASTEELKASNEELQAMNEELRSATEELETSREELQSINEELTTVNQELKNKVDELGHANSDMQNLMDATAIATVFLDRDLRITRYTPSAVSLFNLISTDLGRPLSNLTNQLNYPQLDDDARSVLQGLIPIEREVGDDRHAWFLVRMLPYRTGEDRIAGIVLTLVDITERKRNQEELAASRAKLIEALEANEHARHLLETADVAKDRFLAVLSHELRNPLASISGATDTLVSPHLPDGHRERAQVILRRQVGAMRSLLSDLLDVSRLRFGRMTLSKRRIALADVVDQALETASAIVDGRHHELVREVGSEGATLQVDPERMVQVLSNLVINAAKYTPEGGRIILRAGVDGGQCVIDVIDNGIGLDADTLESMFDLFWQGGAVDLRGNQGVGMGIGLALARTVVELHEGRIAARSEGRGTGSTITVTLPIGDGGDAAGALAQPPPVEVAEAVPASTGIQVLRRIAIVDDVEDVAWTLAAAIGAHGHDVRTAHDGPSAIALAEEFRPEVMLLDIGMPGLSGLDVAKRLRAMPVGRRLLLIAATGWGSDSDRQASELAGFDAHLVKPIVVAELRALMDRWLPSRD